MKTRRRKVSDDAPTISRKKPQSSNSEPIPIDLIYEILLKLPAKSIARSRCVSKLWASILVRSDFTDSFFTRSASRPQILFSFEQNDERFFFSSPQTQIQNSDENSSLVTPKYCLKFPFYNNSEICGHVHGLVCFKHLRISKGRKQTVLEILNPSTGESLTLPKVRTNRVNVRSFFVYDPIGKQFKVLSMTWPGSQRMCSEHQILTLGGNRKLSWKIIECSKQHQLGYERKGICINGCLYYQAMVDEDDRFSTIVCFHVSSEKFTFVRKSTADYGSTLVNYKGKLGMLMLDAPPNKISLKVLVDTENHEWSKHTYVLPILLKNAVGRVQWLFVGMTSSTYTDEIVLYNRDTLEIVYYDIQKNTVRRFEIQEMEACKSRFVHTFLNHAEDVKLFANF